MPLHSLRVRNVGPFEDAFFEFDEHVNVFVGPNNSGKSTVLWALGDIAVNPFLFPEKLLRGNGARFDASYTGVDSKVKTLRGEHPIGLSEDEEGYWTDSRYAEAIGVVEALGYTCFIPALRRSTDYRSGGPSAGENGVTARALRGKSGEEIAELVRELRTGRHGDRQRLMLATLGPDPMQIEDSDVIQSLVDLDYKAYREERPSVRKVFDALAKVASDITEGFPIRFTGVAEDKRGLFPKFSTPDGELPLNTLSQGTQSIVQWLGRFLVNLAEHYHYPEDLESQRAVLIIDEIDAHLHPSWQRRILPALTKTFPKLQIFCSTHSPLMISGLKAGQVHLLNRDAKGKVTVSRNETDIVGWSADEILRNILDVPNPTDLATAEKIQRLQELRRKKLPTKADKDELEALRENVGSDLLGAPISDEILSLAQKALGKTGAGRKRSRVR